MKEEVLFSDACDYVTTHTKDFSDEQKIKLYALFKQGTVGGCNIDRPGGLFNWQRKKMWDEWNSLKEKNIIDPKQMYVNYLTCLVTNWKIC
jgi:acyl-CoA-binding protein